MITYSIIQKSQLEGALRIDAEYYQPEYLEFTKRLASIGKIPLGKIAFITDGQHGYHKLDPSSDVRHITAKNVLHWLVNDENADRLAIETHNANKRSNLEIGDLLISTAGTIGAVGIVQEDILPANIDQDVARVHILNQKEIDPYFLIAFLNSKYGQSQLMRQTTGQIQTHVSLDKIKTKIFIPIPKWQNIVAVLVKSALASLKESEDLYSQAENLLLEELGLKDFKVEDDLSFVVNLSDVKIANRIDAEYYQPKYAKLIAKIKKKCKTIELGEIAIVKRGSLIDPIFYDEMDGIPYIRGKDFSTGRLENSDLVYINNKFLAKNETRLKEGDIVFALIGSVGDLGLTLREFANSFISNNTGKISIKNKNAVLPEYLTAVLHSIIGRFQFNKEASQTAQPKISDGQIRNFVIPILPKVIQEKIVDLVRKSHEARKKSKELLEEAKRKVEEMIDSTSSLQVEKGSNNGN